MATSSLTVASFSSHATWLEQDRDSTPLQDFTDCSLFSEHSQLQTILPQIIQLVILVSVFASIEWENFNLPNLIGKTEWTKHHVVYQLGSWDGALKEAGILEVAWTTQLDAATLWIPFDTCTFVEVTKVSTKQRVQEHMPCFKTVSKKNKSWWV